MATAELDTREKRAYKDNSSLYPWAPPAPQISTIARAAAVAEILKLVHAQNHFKSRRNP